MLQDKKQKKSPTISGRMKLTNFLVLVFSIAAVFVINQILFDVFWDSITSLYIDHWYNSVDQLKEDFAIYWFTSVNNWMDMLTLLDWSKEFPEIIRAFLMYMAVDIVLCIVAVVLINYFFMNHLLKKIRQPIHELDDAAERIKNSDLTTDINYSGFREFEKVCDTFNDMQHHIIEEQEQNRQYEKARSDMIAGISHDLKSPLTAVKGSIKAIQDGVASTDEMQKKFLDTAYRRAGDMDVLLNQLFFQSKLETGNMPLYMQDIKITEFLQSYVEAKSENIEMDIVNTDDSVRISLDPEQFQRVLDNLYDNSRKYADSDPLKITITLAKPDDGHICISFADNGSGVPEDKLPYIFNEFYRTDESRSRKKGSGLGLYIVKYLTEAMGGEISAENAGGLKINMTYKIVVK